MVIIILITHMKYVKHTFLMMIKKAIFIKYFEIKK